jgi:hypothetical protein
MIGTRFSSGIIKVLLVIVGVEFSWNTSVVLGIVIGSVGFIWKPVIVVAAFVASKGALWDILVVCPVTMIV